MNKHQFDFFRVLIVGLLVFTGRVESQLLSLQHEPRLDWRTLKTENFSIHFPAGFEDLGRRVGAICEEIYGPVSRSLNYYPGPTQVVIHTRIDSPDGVVSFLPWRMELFVTEPQGNGIGSGDEWLRILIIHEFTHIVQLRKRKGFTALSYPLLGDFNALGQQITPNWFIEGFATLNETRYTAGGRGRNPYHWMQMAAPIQVGRPWRLENTNYHSRKRMPSTRMRYVTGYYLSNYVNQLPIPDVWTKILDRYTAFPLPGFGSAVKSVTGKSPKQLYSEMMEKFNLFPRKQVSFAPSVRVWRTPENPEDQHSPRWVDNDHIIFYRKSFDDLPEIVEIDRSGTLRQIRQRALSKIDNSFSVGSNIIIWSELRPHPRFSATIYSDLKLYNRRSGRVRTLTRQARIYSPDLSPDGTQVVAVQTALPTTKMVTVTLQTGEIKPVLEVPRATLLNPRWSPNGKWIAFALKDSTGLQDIAIMDVQTRRWRYLYPQDSNHDNNPCWTPDSRYILFASDRSGVFNIWAVELSTGKRWMITDSELGAFTPDVSPDGNELAFKSYTETGFTVVTMILDSARWLKETNVQPYVNYMIFTARDTINSQSNRFSPTTLLQIKPYRPGRQILRPQGWIPYLYKDESGKAVGLFAISKDVLNRHTWMGNFGLSPKDLRPSIDFYYLYRRWWPQIIFRTYSLPEQISNRSETGWWRNRGIELVLFLPLTLESNVYKTVFQPFSRVKHNSWVRSTGRIYPKLQNYRGLQLGFDLRRTGQAVRDIVPHRAWYISAFSDWTNSTLGSDYDGQQFCGRINIFLPTYIKHHQIEFQTRFQNRKGNFNYAFYNTLPIGYVDDQQRNQLRFRLAYIFPISYLEFPIPFLPIYIDYLDAAVFHDWGASWNREFNPRQLTEVTRYSTGIQVTAVNYIFQRLRIRLGVVLYYHSVKQEWKTAHIIEYSF